MFIDHAAGQEPDRDRQCFRACHSDKCKTTLFNAQPTMLWSENDLLNCLFSTYAVIQYAYHTGKITREKYFEWNLQWSFGSTITHSSSLPADIEALSQNSNED